MPEPTARAALYTQLADVIGVDHAGVLMSYLPGDEPATKTDVLAVKEDVLAVKQDMLAVKDDMADRMDRVEDRMDRFEDKLDGFKDILIAQGKFYTGSMVTAILVVSALHQLF